MIKFNIPYQSSDTEKYLKLALESESQSTDGKFVKKCAAWFEENYSCEKAFMTHSCTGALEMAALTIGIEPGNEVIVPAFTHISTANAFALRGAKIVFADILADTMCIDPADVKQKISPKTKAVIAMHYGGYTTEIEEIVNICKKNGLYLIEDAAHSIGATHNSKYHGTFGDIGCISFHETKNIHCGEGGVFLLNNKSLLGNAEEIYEKGSNRNAFLRNEVSEYSWTGLGSSFGMNNLSAAMLWAQLQDLEMVNEKRLAIWNNYYSVLKNITGITMPLKPELGFNAHIFYIKIPVNKNNVLLSFLNKNGISAHKHFPPLNISPFGKSYGPIVCPIAESEYQKLIRLPMHTGIKKADIKFIAETIFQSLKKANIEG